MSTVLQDTPTPYRLEATLPPWCVLKARHAMLCGAFVAVFLLLCYLPVSVPHTWHDVVLGRSGWYSGTASPASIAPLSEGMRHLTLGRGGHWLVAQLHQLGGPRLLALSLGVVGTAQMLLWALTLHRLTGTWHWCLGAIFIFASSMFEWGGLNCLVLGQTAFAIFIWLLSGDVEQRTNRLCWSATTIKRRCAMAALFCVWSNLHASFLVGLIVLACLVLDRMLTLPASPKRIARLADPELLSRLGLFEMAFLGTAFNPDGIAVWQAMFWWPDQPYIHALGGWSPPSMISWPSMFLAVGWAIWHRTSQRREWRDWNRLALLATAVVTCSQSQLHWCVPLLVVACAASSHRSHDKRNRSVSTDEVEHDTVKPLRFAYTLISGLIVWLGICFSPASELVNRSDRDEASVVGREIPVRTAAYLAEHAPTGLVFCPHYWSDYLLAQTPIKVFVTSDTHWLPESVVGDYHRISSAESNWNELTQKYAVDQMVIDKSKQKRLARDIRRGTTAWRIVHEDEQAMVVRKGNGQS